MTERRLAAILSADIAGYSRLMAEDEDETIRLVTARRQQVGLLLEQHRGRLVDFSGDNFLAEFGSAVDAVECAVEIQRVGVALNADLPPEQKMEFRIGLHLGEVQVQDDRLFGTGVNIAARLEAVADPGGVCISQEVHREVASRTRFEFRDLGDQEVKNIPGPVHAFAVEVPEASTPVQAAARPTWAIPAVLVALAALLGGGWWWLQGDDEELVAERKLPTSVVVLPFDDMSPEGDQEPFAHGMSEELTNALTRVPGLRVVGRTTAEVVKERRLTIDEIGAQLAVEAVVEGSVRRAGDRLRITAQLIAVDSGFHLWAETYERPLGDVFAIQDELATAISDALEVRLVSRPKHPSDLRAYELTLLGVRHFHRYNAQDMEKAVQSFEAALAIEPDYALARAWLANALVGLLDMDLAGPEILEAAEAEARRSLALDPDLPEAPDILGVVLWFKGQYAEGLREVDRSLELNPGFALAYLDRANILAEFGRIDEAREAVDRASDLDPLSALIVYGSGRIAYLGEDYEAAIERMERGRALGNSYWADLALALAAVGQAEQSLELQIPADASEETRQQLQATFEESGFPRAARAAFDARAAAAGQACTEDPMTGALQLALSGDAERMFDCLDEAREQIKLHYVKVNPVFAPYRDDPRFQAILEGMGMAD